MCENICMIRFKEHDFHAGKKTLRFARGNYMISLLVSHIDIHINIRRKNTRTELVWKVSLKFIENYQITNQIWVLFVFNIGNYTCISTCSTDILEYHRQIFGLGL